MAAVRRRATDAHEPASAPVHMKLHSITALLLLTTALACDSKPAEAGKTDTKKTDGKTADAKDAKGGDAKVADAKAADAKPADDGPAVPTETETIALDQGESKIPATIDAPKGSTTFNDDATSIRVDWGEGRERGDAFGVQVKKGNEFNLNLDETEKMMLKNEYGNTNKILEKTPTLLRYTMSYEGGTPAHNFVMIVDLKGEKWICEQGTNGGYTEEQSKRQQQACATLKAK